jgi:hypothetical protein
MRCMNIGHLQYTVYRVTSIYVTFQAIDFKCYPAYNVLLTMLLVQQSAIQFNFVLSEDLD